MEPANDRIPDVETEKDLDSLFLSLVENLPVYVARKNVRGEITFANQAFCRLLGIKREAVLGKTDFDLFPKDLAEKYRHDDMLVERTGETFCDIEANYSGGETHYFEVRKTPVRTGDGDIVGTQVIFWDVSAHKRTEAELDQERQLLNALLANTPDHIVFKDAEGKFIRVSRAHARLIGCNDPADAIGISDADVFPKDYAMASREDELQVMRSGRSLVGKEEELCWPNGHRSWVSTTKAPLRNYRGEVVGTFSISRDITNRKMAEEAQRQAVAAAEAANRAKSDFLANMSHEIRTPLNAIIGMTELVLDSELNTQQHDYLRTVLASGETLLGIINQILDFSKIEARRVDLESVPFVLREVLGDTLKSLAFHAHSKGLELAWHVDTNVPHELIGDPTRLNQIIVNLVGNAIKFTTEGEVVLRIESTRLDEDRERLHISVADTGIGIPEQEQQNVFSAFQQADTSTTREYGGTGLGLSISSRLSELMDGAIWVESEPRQGSTFHVELCFQVPKGARSPADDENHQLQGVRALVVDDNETNRLILSENLKAWDMDVTLCSSATDALEHLRSSDLAPQVVITDHQMPLMDGVEMIEQIREDKRFAQLPIIVLTSGTRRFDLPRLRKLGVELRLLKPVKPSELKTAIGNSLGVKSTSAEPVDSRVQSMAQPVVTLDVLLAEDGWANQKLAAGLLEKWGHRVTIASNGKEAVDLVNSDQHFDLILMDVQMPVMDGLEATRTIREMEDQQAAQLPIIAMTAHVKIGDEQRCLEAGMDGYLSKPVRREQLYEAIQEVAAEKRHSSDDPDRGNEPTDGGETSKPRDPGFNVEHAMESVENDRDLLQAVTEAYLDEAPKLLKQLQEALDAEEAVAAKRAAHTLKGATRIYGNESLTELARTLEQLGGEGHFAEARQQLSALKRAVEKLSQDLRDYLARPL